MTGHHCLRCGRGPLVPKNANHAGIEHQARGLCGACYRWCRCNNALEKYPCSKAPAVDRARVVREYRELSDQGMTMAEIAQRIGVGRTALYGALARDQRPAGRLGDVELERLRRMVGVAS